MFCFTNDSPAMGGDGKSAKMFGVTSPISMSTPTALDIRWSKSLEETLRSLDMFESEEGMAKR